MHYRSIVSAVSVCLSSLSLLALPTRAENKQLDFNSEAPINQTTNTRQVAFMISSDRHQSFKDLMQQAELLASNLIAQEFGQNSSIKEIAVRVVGERNGQEAPLLFSQVSRADWQRQPRIKQWTKYFNSSEILLGFLELQSPSPTVADNFPSSRATGNSSQRFTSPGSTSPVTTDNSTPPSTSPTTENATSPTTDALTPDLPSSASPDNPLQQPPESVAPLNNLIQQPTSPLSPGTSKPSGGSREETDPGYR